MLSSIAKLLSCELDINSIESDDKIYIDGSPYGYEYGDIVIKAKSGTPHRFYNLDHNAKIRIWDIRYYEKGPIHSRHPSLRQYRLIDFLNGGRIIDVVWNWIKTHLGEGAFLTSRDQCLDEAATRVLENMQEEFNSKRWSDIDSGLRDILKFPTRQENIPATLTFPTQYSVIPLDSRPYECRTVEQEILNVSDKRDVSGIAITRNINKIIVQARQYVDEPEDNIELYYTTALLKEDLLGLGYVNLVHINPERRFKSLRDVVYQEVISKVMTELENPDLGLSGKQYSFLEQVVDEYI